MGDGPKTRAQMTTTKDQIATSGRILGFRHRVKVRIVDGEPTEPLPSEVVIMSPEGHELGRINLEDEQAELDFIQGVFPTRYRYVDPQEDISAVPPWQIKWRTATEDESQGDRHGSQCEFQTKRGKGGQPPTQKLIRVASEVPSEWTGLQPGDRLAMSLGGSGDYFGFSAARRLHTMGGEVYRIPPFKLKENRGAAPKTDDAKLLAECLITGPGDFYPTFVRDLAIIRVRETFHLRMAALKNRMACASWLREQNKGNTFCSIQGGFPEGGIEKAYEMLKATDASFVALEAQEASALKAMTEAVEATDVWAKIFADFPGVGPAIAARIISAIIDIRRFRTSAKLKKFMGVHVRADGSFPRRRSGQVADWHPDARQALYLLADQFVKNPNSKWGKKLTGYKASLRVRHPQVCVQVKDAETSKLFPKGLAPIGEAPQKRRPYYDVPHPSGEGTIRVSGSQRYGNGHIHKMAIWRTLTRFVEWLHAEWWRIEREAQKASTSQV